MDGRAVEKCTVADAGGKTLFGGGIEDDGGAGAPILHHRRTDGEMRAPLHEGNGAVDRIDDEDLAFVKPGRIVRALLRQPAIIGAGAQQMVLQEIVHRQIGFGDGAAAGLAPASGRGAEECQRKLAGLAHRGFQ